MRKCLLKPQSYRFWTVGTWGKNSNVEHGEALVDNTKVWEGPRDSPTQCTATSGTGDRGWIEYGGLFQTGGVVFPTWEKGKEYVQTRPNTMT